MKLHPFITVCLATYNESLFIAAVLQKLIRQDYPLTNFEIIVADGGSNDGTRDIVKRFARKHIQIRLMRNRKRLTSAGRNLAFKSGKGDIFLTIDGHCYIPTNQMFQDIVDLFEMTGADCLARPQLLDPPGITNFQKAIAIARSSRFGHASNSLIYSNYEGFVNPTSNGAVYKRSVIDQIGFFDETLNTCEDLDYNYRIFRKGFQTYMSPRLTIKYYPRENLSELFLQVSRYGYGRFRFYLKHAEALTIEMLLVPIPIISTVFFMFISLYFSFFWKIFIVIFSLYIGFVILLSFLNSFQKEIHLIRHLPFIYVIIHFGFSYGYLKGFFSPSNLRFIIGIIAKVWRLRVWSYLRRD